MHVYNTPQKIFCYYNFICFTIVFIDSVANSNISGAISTLLLIFINVLLLKYNIDKYIESQETQTTVIKDIKEFSVDSTLTISGADTTKTYTLTYWK